MTRSTSAPNDQLPFAFTLTLALFSGLRLDVSSPRL